MKNRFHILFFLAALSFTACTDVIDVDLDEGEVQLVVDAFINDLPQPQVIRLRNSAPYFSNDFNPAVTGAIVTVTDGDGEVFEFVDAGNTGDYTWTPEDGETFGEVGQIYVLAVSLPGDSKTFGAQTQMNRVPPIDSIVSEFREDELGGPDGHYAQFFARDEVGFGDSYWIKTFKNGEFLNKGFELNIAYDAAFAPGAPPTRTPPASMRRLA